MTTVRRAPSRRASIAVRASERDLRMVALIEGVPGPRAEALAAATGLSVSGASRMIQRLRDRGVARKVTAVRLTSLLGEVECLSYLRTCWREPQAQAVLEAKLVADPQVSEAVRLSGREDLAIRSFHRNARDASDWHRMLLTSPPVLEGRLLFCRTLFTGVDYAAALLGGAR